MDLKRLRELAGVSQLNEAKKPPVKMLAFVRDPAQGESQKEQIDSIKETVTQHGGKVSKMKVDGDNVHMVITIAASKPDALYDELDQRDDMSSLISDENMPAAKFDKMVDKAFAGALSEGVIGSTGKIILGAAYEGAPQYALKEWLKSAGSGKGQNGVKFVSAKQVYWFCGTPDEVAKQLLDKAMDIFPFSASDGAEAADDMDAFESAVDVIKPTSLKDVMKVCHENLHINFFGPEKVSG